MRILSIDPGLDYVAAARFDYDGSRPWAAATADAKMRALMSIAHCTTKAADPLPLRLETIAATVARWCAEDDIDWVVIETPAMAGGAYGAKRGKGVAINSAAMGHFHMALGATIASTAAALGHQRVQLYRASSRMKKADRLSYTRELYGKVWGGALNQDFRKLNADAADALYVGLAVSWPTL
jgi:Holliday junction resolvasome RuvABC endonuclease subunit